MKNIDENWDEEEETSNPKDESLEDALAKIKAEIEGEIEPNKTKKKSAKKSTKKLPPFKLKSGEKSLDKSIDYSILADFSAKEVDLSFSLKTPLEDRYFAYTLTLMDLLNTLEDLQDIAPQSVIDEFITTLQVIKSMVESLKRKIEEELGLKTPLLSDDKKEHLKKMMKGVKGKLEEKFPGAKIVNVKDGDIPEELKNLINEMGKEIKKRRSGAKPSQKETPKEEDNFPERKNSTDLEF